MVNPGTRAGDPEECPRKTYKQRLSRKHALRVAHNLEKNRFESREVRQALNGLV